jgi:cytochrome c oxidase subunit 1
LSGAGTSSILGAVNFIVTIWKMRVPSLKWDQIPLFCWAMVATSILALFSTPVLAAGLILLLFDINFGTSFFRPDAGGNVVMYQHLFWFYSHPAVYLMILPIFGIMSEVIPVHARKPIFGYKAIAYSSLTILSVGLFVWVHHMFTSGTPPWMRMFFTVSTLIVAVPTGSKSLAGWRPCGAARFALPAPCCLRLVCWPCLCWGASAASPWALLPSTFTSTTLTTWWPTSTTCCLAARSLASTRALYHWFPKITGRMLNEKLGQVHFVLTFVGTNLTFTPMHQLGMQGMPRRVAMYDPQFEAINQLVYLRSFLLGFR